MTYLYSVCSAVYATLAVIIAIQARSATNVMLAACCVTTAVWAATGAAWASLTLHGAIGLIDTVRLLTWYAYLLYLYHKTEIATKWQSAGFATIVPGVLGVAIAYTAFTSEPASYTLFSWSISLRLIVSICELLLIENLYFNLPENSRWHVALPCILLGALACFDILVAADTALFRRPSILLASARVIAMIIVAPLLVLAAFRT